MSAIFDPFWLFRLPLSGNVDQRISAPWFSPALTVNYAGNAVIEEQVVTEVASYGRQIGWLNEIVLALAKDTVPDSKTLEQLAAAVKAINAIKEKHKQSALTVAVEALDQLKEGHPEEYEQLLRTRNLRSTLNTVSA